MPTNQNSYNTRLTDEALEKRFRDTFRSQGGAELVDDLYASGVIIPIVDFTQAAEGSQLPSNLQTAWDFSTGSSQVTGTNTVVISNPGFWQVDLNAEVFLFSATATWQVNIYDGSSSKIVWAFTSSSDSSPANTAAIASENFVVFLRSGDSLRATAASAAYPVDIWYRQIADVNGNLVNPLGFTSQ